MILELLWYSEALIVHLCVHVRARLSGTRRAIRECSPSHIPFRSSAAASASPWDACGARRASCANPTNTSKSAGGRIWASALGAPIVSRILRRQRGLPPRRCSPVRGVRHALLNRLRGGGDTASTASARGDLLRDRGGRCAVSRGLHDSRRFGSCDTGLRVDQVFFFRRRLFLCCSLLFRLCSERTRLMHPLHLRFACCAACAPGLSRVVTQRAIAGRPCFRPRNHGSRRFAAPSNACSAATSCARPRIREAITRLGVKS
mmetsp:Transcript_798/g.2118  ORF Transcript_798/g.2118 Transcript_798/m.2118 type:complete len:260 (-) Transcript_798:807-1586(-)